MQAKARAEEDARKEVHRKTEIERLNSAIEQHVAALATYAGMRRLPPGRYRPPVARVREVQRDEEPRRDECQSRPSPRALERTRGEGDDRTSYGVPMCD